MAPSPTNRLPSPKTRKRSLSSHHKPISFIIDPSKIHEGTTSKYIDHDTASEKIIRCSFHKYNGEVRLTQILIDGNDSNPYEERYFKTPFNVSIDHNNNIRISPIKKSKGGKKRKTQKNNRRH